MAFSIEEVRDAVMSDLGIEDLDGATLDVEYRGVHTWSWEYADSMTHDWGFALWRNEIGEFEFTISEGSSSYEGEPDAQDEHSWFDPNGEIPGPDDAE